MDDLRENQNESAAWMAGKSFVAVVEHDGEYIVVQHSASGGVAPQSPYPDARSAAARLLQLLRVGPVAPQTHPETACIGTIEREQSE